MFTQVLEQLMQYSGKHETCLTLILPLAHSLPERKQNTSLVRQRINQTKEVLKERYPDVKAQELIKQLDQVAIDYKKVKNGVGIFVASELLHIVYFPFPVEEKVVIDQSFEVRDLVWGRNQWIDYWVLSLDQKETRLFKGVGDALEEIKDDQIPLGYEEQYQYPDRQRPAISGDYVSEETLIKDERLKQYYRHLNKIVLNYIKKAPLPMVLTGVKEHFNVFLKIFDYPNLVVSQIPGNYEHQSATQLAKKVWPAITSYIDQQHKDVLNDIANQVGKRGYLYGIEAAYRTAEEGRAEILVVEKNYTHPAYRSPKKDRLLFNVSEPKGLNKKVDAVDDIIETVLSKKGKVVFMENGQLEDYQHIAVKTRY